MGLLVKARWQEWARQWGLQYLAQRGVFVRNEALVGAYKGFLVRIGWMGEYGSELAVVIRFPKQPDASRLHKQLLRDPELARLPGWKSKPTPTFVVDESNLLWKRSILWTAPKPAAIQGWVDQLIQGLSKLIPRFDGHCEHCGSSGVDRYVLYEDVPVYLCTTCQERFMSEGTMAERQYAQADANHLAGTLLGSAAAAVGGVLWALLAVFTKHIYSIVAIGIAWLVAHAYYYGAKKIDRVGQVIGAGLTMGGVVLGDVLFYAYLIHKEQPEVPFRLEVGWAVWLQVLTESPGQVVISLLLGLVGAWYVLRMLQKPRFKPKIERPQTA